MSTSSAIAWEEPEGLVPVGSPFYVERLPTEPDCYDAIASPGALIRIKAPRQMGKTSLLVRILDHAQQQGWQVVRLSLQTVENQILTDLDEFLQWFCASVTEELDLPDVLADYWKGSRGLVRRCQRYFEKYLLTTLQTPLVLGLDEVDQVFEHPEIATDFFGMLRVWHEEGKTNPLWRKLHLVIVHSKEVYVPLSINRSPFNVGVPIDLRRLSLTEIESLIDRHDLDLTLSDQESLIALVGGHPYLLRMALYQLARNRKTLPELLAEAPTDGGLFSDHLRRHLLNLEADTTLITAFRRVIQSQQPIAIGSTEGFKLKSMGLVDYQGSAVVPTCELYRRYFRDHLDALLDLEDIEDAEKEGDRPYPWTVPSPAISPTPKIYLSYAWGGESEALVDRLDAAFQLRGVTIVRDQRDLGYKGLIKSFMEQIGRGRCVVAVISDQYLKSDTCMFELVQIAQNGEFYDRIFPIVLADAQIYKPTQRIRYIQYWEQEIAELEQAMKTVGAANMQGFREAIDQYTQIRNTMAQLLDILKDMNTLTPESHKQANFEPIFQAIEQKLAE